MAHTASAGVYLYQDPHSGVWQVGSSAKKQTFAQRLWLATLPFRSSKLVIGTSAATAGVILSLLASYFVLNGGLPKNPILALQPPPPSTQSVGLSDAPYMAANAPVAEALPLPTSPGEIQLPPPLIVKESQPLAPLGNMPPSVANVRPQTPAKVQSKDEAPLAIFNQPLQPKAVESQPGKQPNGPLSVQTRADSVVTGVQATPVRNDQSPTPGAQKTVQSAATAGNSAADPAALVVRPSTPQAVNILAVHTAESIVITNPSTRLPMVVKLGDRLPDGSTLKTVDKSNSSATNSRGETLSLR